MTLFLQVFRKVTEEVDMGGMADVDEEFQGDGWTGLLIGNQQSKNEITKLLELRWLLRFVSFSP